MTHTRNPRAVSDEKTLTFTFQRELAVTPDVAFEAWTTPAQLTEWWDPDGDPLVECAVDLRVGGRFRFVNRTHGQGRAFEGTYQTIERPSKLVFEAQGAVGTVRLEADAAGTRMTVTIRSPSPEHFAMFTKLAVAAGTDVTLDNLTARCERIAGRR